MNNKNSSVGEIVVRNKVFIILLMLVIALSIYKPVFYSTTNLMNVLRQVTVNAIVAVGFTFVLAIGMIDLSVGSQVGIIGIMIGSLLIAGVPIAIACILAVIAGVLLGLLNATIISKFNLQPFIVTLGMSSILRGAGYVWTHMEAIYGFDDSFNNLGKGFLLGIPIPVYVLTIIVIAAFFFIERTTVGRHIIAVGGNPEAARVCGINVIAIRGIVFGIMGACAGIASVLQTARSASAQVTAGNNMEMDAIAAVVIGGTSMMGGNANIMGTLAGCLLVGVVSNGLNLMAVDSNWQVIAKGALILFAVILDSVSTSILKKSQVKKVMQ